MAHKDGNNTKGQMMVHARNKALLAIAILLSFVGTAAGQGCPGFKNPTTFNTYNSSYFWSARVGDRTYTSGNTNDTTTGDHIMSTCVNHSDILGHDNITSSTYNSGSDYNITGCQHTFFDANDSRFQIITSENDGIDQFTVGNNSTGIPRIPTGYLTSIRLGDMRSTGQAVDLSSSMTTGNNKGAEALFYTMNVNTQNTLIFINYAIVARRYSHTAYDAGEFLIRVVAQNTDGSWPNEPINDSLWYKVSAPTFNNNEMPTGWSAGYGITGTCSYAYKPWTKVAINLNRYLYRKVRIEMYTSDCIYNFDPIYAYIVGDYQAMTIHSAGCADSRSNVIDTLRAPEGLISYQWHVTKQGYESSLNNDSHMDTVHFRPVSGVGNTNVYMPVPGDFVISEGPNTGDTVGKQTFRCTMTSALDPNKPITSKLYTNVSNNKPVMRFRTEHDCDLGVQFFDQSFTYGDALINPDSTRWIIYNDSLGTTPMDTLWGAQASYQFPAEGGYLVSLRNIPYSVYCEALTSKVVHAYTTHTPRIGVENHTICENTLAKVWCDTDCHLNRQWIIGNRRFYNTDTVTWVPELGNTNITLTIFSDTSCPNSVSDSIKCYGYVKVNTSSESPEICPGDSVVISVEGLDELRWSSVPPDPSLNNSDGQSSIVVHPEVTTTYNIESLVDVPCLRDIEGITIEVLPYPIPKIETNKSFADITDPTIRFTDRSENGFDRLWTFSDGSHSTESPVDHTFIIEGVDSVGVNLLSCNRIQCCSDTSMMFEVKSTALWFPNAFTPGRDNNNIFGVVTAASIPFYEIYIYNRQGILVYHSTDINQTWDGTHKNGMECPQGAYVYRYRYSLDMAPENIMDGRGTVTLIR